MVHGSVVPDSRHSFAYEEVSRDRNRRLRWPLTLAQGFIARLSNYRSRTPALLAGLGFATVVAVLFSYSSVTERGFQERFPLVHLPVDERGFCERVLVHRFTNEQGIASELATHVRAAALQATLGYALVLDTQDYIYGDIAGFWRPPKHPCSLPADALNTTSAARFADADLNIAPRVYITHNDDHIRRLDNLVREQSINTELMRELTQREKLYQLVSERLTLPYGESVSAGVMTAFLQQAEAIARIARPTPEMQVQIDHLSAKLGLNQRRTYRRRPVVALQVDIGDAETARNDILKAGTHMPSNDLLPFFHAAELALTRLYDADITPPPKTFPRPRQGEKPLLVVMTTDLNVVIRLQSIDITGKFEILQSPRAELTPKEEEEYKKLSEAPQSYGGAISGEGLSTRSIDPLVFARWEQWMLFESSPALRLALSRHLLVELTVYATRADAFIVRGSSDLGRIAMLLAGEEGVIGSGRQRLVGGRVRSIDVPFYPTAHRSAIFPPT